MKKVRFISAIVTLSLVIGFASCEKDDSDFFGLSNTDEAAVSDTSDLKCAVDSFVVTDSLIEDEINGLLWMREEEKLAMDVYDLLYETFGLRIFDNISNSEQSHTNAVLSLIEFYGYADPALETAGEFSNADLQQLYDDLVLNGTTSAVEALMTGALIEEVDILDLEEELVLTDDPNIIAVYENLLAGSKKHLVSFVRNLANYGITYTPQQLESSVYEEILATTTFGRNN